MDLPINSNTKRIQESNQEIFRTRFLGRLCLVFVCITQILPRIMIIFASPLPKSNPVLFVILSLLPLTLMIIAIAIEYFFFKRQKQNIPKVSIIVDLILLFLFTIDWVQQTFYCVRLIRPAVPPLPPTFEITALYGFISFSWRTILVMLIVQKWWLKIIPPSAALILAGVYGIIYTPGSLIVNLIRIGSQLLDLIVIIYCEDKIKWRMIWSNLQHEKWMQVNNFILNSLPENVIILDFRGEVKFVSDYCKSFMKKNHLSTENTGDFFQRIQDLEQQEEDESEFGRNSMRERFQIEKLTTGNEALVETSQNNAGEGTLKIETLWGLLRNFKKTIGERNLQERQFLVYNGKLRIENSRQHQQHLQEKSIEIKISFVHHVDNGYLILILRDTSQRDLLLTLQETNKYQDQLLASVSHELRAPLNGNINLVESALASPSIPEDLKETLLAPALHGGKFLLHLINDIIDMSQIKQKKLRLVFESKNLQETLRSAAQLVELQAIKKGVELTLDFDSKLPSKFSTDHMRLSQIVLNLLSNAVKFTKEGTVKLSAIPLCNGNWVKILVEDSGIGICKGNLNKLFTSSANIDCEERQTLNPRGVGLGLNIASNLVGMLAPKGNSGISVSSTPNQGSIFSFMIENRKVLFAPIQKKYVEVDQSNSSCEILAQEIPMNNQLKPQSTLLRCLTPLLEKNNLEVGKCSCSKVLIVDDNPFNTMAFDAILNSLNVKSDSVFSGSACIQRLLDRKNKSCGRTCKSYAAIFMDQEMPEMTGSETVEEIRRLQIENVIPDLKIIGCTAHKIREEVDRFMESGLDSCIFKPISAMIIKDILKEIL